MSILIDLNAVDNPSKVGTGGPVKPGRCHVALISFEEYGETKTGSHIASWEILAHDDPSHVGKTYKDFLSDPANGKSDKARAFATERLLHYCYTLGVTTPEAMEAAKRGGQMPNLDISSAVGRQAFMELAEEVYEGKKNVRIDGAGFSIFSLHSPEAKGFPVNAGMKAKAERSQAGPVASTHAAPAAKEDPFAAVT